MMQGKITEADALTIHLKAIPSGLRHGDSVDSLYQSALSEENKDPG